MPIFLAIYRSFLLSLFLFLSLPLFAPPNEMKRVGEDEKVPNESIWPKFPPRWQIRISKEVGRKGQVNPLICTHLFSRCSNNDELRFRSRFGATLLLANLAFPSNFFLLFLRSLSFRFGLNSASREHTGLLWRQFQL